MLCYCVGDLTGKRVWCKWLCLFGGNADCALRVELGNWILADMRYSY